MFLSSLPFCCCVCGIKGICWRMSWDTHEGWCIESGFVLLRTDMWGKRVVMSTSLLAGGLPELVATGRARCLHSSGATNVGKYHVWQPSQEQPTVACVQKLDIRIPYQHKFGFISQRPNLGWGGLVDTVMNTGEISMTHKEATLNVYLIRLIFPPNLGSGPPMNTETYILSACPMLSSSGPKRFGRLSSALIKHISNCKSRDLFWPTLVPQQGSSLYHLPKPSSPCCGPRWHHRPTSSVLLHSVWEIPSFWTSCERSRGVFQVCHSP